MVEASARLPLFPDSTHLERSPNGERLTLAGCDLAALAEQYGTPLYLYDQLTLANNLADYRKALEAYPAPSGLTYAGKAFLCLALAQWVHRSGLWLDCTGHGELAVAAAAGLPPSAVIVHGVNKSQADLQAAFSQASVIVVDHLAEVERLIAAGPGSPAPLIWLRLRPGLAVDTHRHIQTGQPEAKFGMAGDELSAASRLCRDNGLTCAGLHFHLGSQLRDPAPLATAIAQALDLAAELLSAGLLAPNWTLSTGGGWGVAYHEADLPHPSIEAYVAFICKQVESGCRQRLLALPRLQLEPGRSLVARAGVALYRIGAVKHSETRTWLLLDGGLADNPRPALYGARYSALPVSEPSRPLTIRSWFGGPYCESGDVLIEDLPFPEVETGELVAVPMSGAYQLSMSSNYNGALRPAVLWLADGKARLVQRRQTEAELLERDSLLE